MFCVKFHVFDNNQVGTSCVAHGKLCGASVAALRGEYSFLRCAVLMAKELFQASHYTEEVQKKTVKKKYLCFPYVPNEFELFEEESSSREHM